MTEKKTIIGFVGPSGVGKGYCKEAIKTRFPDFFTEPIVVTTRPPRSSDGIDRKAGINPEEFAAMNSSGAVILAHQLSGPDSHWYGFLTESLESTEKFVLTEVHVDNIIPFKDRYGDSVRLIALVANQEYLRENILNRSTESAESTRSRLEQAIREVDKIRELFENGFLDAVIEVGNHNRDKLGDMVVETVSNFL